MSLPAATSLQTQVLVVQLVDNRKAPHPPLLPVAPGGQSIQVPEDAGGPTGSHERTVRSAQSGVWTPAGKNAVVGRDG